MMANRLRTILLQAQKTFCAVDKKENNILESADFMKLRSLVNELKCTDVHFPAKHVLQGNLRASNPIDHFSVHEDTKIQIGVFILKQGAKIPLHDHPGMHGVIKVLHGTVKITTYDLVGNIDGNGSGNFFYSKELEVTKNVPIELTESDECTILTPSKSNIHEVVCVEGPAAFLDILAPPYDDDHREFVERSCHYFQEITNWSKTIRLIQIANPGDFWINQACS